MRATTPQKKSQARIRQRGRVVPQGCRNGPSNEFGFGKVANRGADLPEQSRQGRLRGQRSPGVRRRASRPLEQKRRRAHRSSSVVNVGQAKEKCIRREFPTASA